MNLLGLKFHDCYILMQQLLLMAIKVIFSKNVIYALLGISKVNILIDDKCHVLQVIVRY